MWAVMGLVWPIRVRSPVTSEELIAFVAERVAPHKKIRLVETIDEIPKSASGKILRRKLVERERVVMLTLVGDASARPLLAAVEAAPSRYDTSSLQLLGSGGAILSADVKDRLLRAIPTVLAITEAIGSSESPVQAVAVAGPHQARRRKRRGGRRSHESETTVRDAAQ